MLGFQPLSDRPLADIRGDLYSGLTPEEGVFTLSGGDVGLLIDRVLKADIGGYTLSGIDIQFILSISQAAVNQVILVGSVSTKIRGFKMIPNFTMVAGDTKELIVSVRTTNGSAVNISGAEIKWQCARSHGKPSVLSKDTTNLGVTITDGPNGIFKVSLDPEDTEDLRGTFFHEAQVTFSDGTISTVLTGTMKVNAPLIEAT